MNINNCEKYIESILLFNKKNLYLLLFILSISVIFVDINIKKIIFFVLLGFIEILSIILVIFLFKNKIINLFTNKIIKSEKESKLNLKTFQYSYIFIYLLLFFSFFLDKRLFYEFNISFIIIILVLNFLIAKIEIK
ncbi:hypothetical protein [Arcobacter sp.]|uniref:hypothetical protein n=1 Tax=Arcobacter sp. TaxID=1872629 RepID=UPI003D0DACFA